MPISSERGATTAWSEIPFGLERAFLDGRSSRLNSRMACLR